MVVELNCRVCGVEKQQVEAVERAVAQTEVVEFGGA